MNPAIRAFYGALLGALIVLLIHPASRHYLTPGIWTASDSKFLRETEALPENLTSLPEPDSLEDMAFWLITGCEQELLRQPLNRDQTLTMVEFARSGAEQDPENAFWRQVEAVFQHNLGNEDSSRQAWRLASLASRWDDYQTDRLETLLDGLSNANGRTLAWHAALAKSKKTEVHARVLLAYARDLLSGELESNDFFLRIATLRNGKLMRDGIKSADGSQYAIEMIDLAAYSPYVEDMGFEHVSRHVPPPVVETARDQFRELSADYQPGSAALIGDTYKENDAWVAYVNADEAETDRNKLIISSVLVSTVPRTLITLGILGGLVYLFGAALSHFTWLQHILKAPWAQIAGLVVGAIVFFSTDLIFAAIWATIAFATFGFRPEKDREALPQGLGGVYMVLISTMSILFAVVLSVYYVWSSIPAQYLLEPTGIQTVFDLEPRTLLNLAAVIVSLVLVSASVWGYVHKYPAEKLAGVSMRKFGLQVCLGCFALGVVIAPICIALDHKYAETALKVFQNEPNYYLTRSQ